MMVMLNAATGHFWHRKGVEFVKLKSKLVFRRSDGKELERGVSVSGSLLNNTFCTAAGHSDILVVSGEDKLWRQEVLNPSRLALFSPSALHLSFTSRSLEFVLVIQTMTRNTAPSDSFSLLPSPFISFPLCVRIVISSSLNPQTTIRSVHPPKNTSRTCTTASNFATAIMASPKPRLVDTLPSVRTRPMKVIVLGLNRTGTMCMFFLPNLSPYLILDIADY